MRTNFFIHLTNFREGERERERERERDLNLLNNTSVVMRFVNIILHGETM